MKEEKEKAINFVTYTSESEFSEEEQNLISQAKEAASMSYSPYSNFKVGAALLMEDGSIILGANQENAAFPEGICAERVAFVKANTTGKNISIRKVAVVAFKDRDLKIATPCGGCRQVMIEVEARQQSDIELIMKTGENEWVRTPNIKSLLPFSFNF